MWLFLKNVYLFCVFFNVAVFKKCVKNNVSDKKCVDLINILEINAKLFDEKSVFVSGINKI